MTQIEPQEVEQLAQARSQANERLREINAEIDVLVYKYRTQLLADRASEIREQQRIIAEIASRQNEIQKRNELELCRVRSQHPLTGKTVAQFKRLPSGNKRLLKRGIVQVFQHGDSIPENTISKPPVGHLVIRQFKKDGSLSKKCDIVGLWHGSWSLPHGWELVDDEPAQD